MNRLSILKYSNVLYCTGGKVKLSQLVPQPDPLCLLVFGMGSDSTHFLDNIQESNSYFEMMSFGVTHILQENCMSTFKVIFTT